MEITKEQAFEWWEKGYMVGKMNAISGSTDKEYIEALFNRRYKEYFSPLKDKVFYKCKETQHMHVDTIVFLEGNRYECVEQCNDYIVLIDAMGDKHTWSDQISKIFERC